jgi:hypothetical protein
MGLDQLRLAVSCGMGLESLYQRPGCRSESPGSPPTGPIELITFILAFVSRS